MLINEEKSLSASEFCCPEGPKSENERSEKIEKYLKLAREKKKLWNMRVTVIPIVVGELEKV